MEARPPSLTQKIMRRYSNEVYFTNNGREACTASDRDDGIRSPA